MFMTLTLRDWWLMQWSTWCLRNSIAKRHQNNGTATNGKFRDCTFVKIKNLHRCVGWFDVQLHIQSPIQAADCAGAIFSLIFPQELKQWQYFITFLVWSSMCLLKQGLNLLNSLTALSYLLAQDQNWNLWYHILSSALLDSSCSSRHRFFR